VSYASVVMSARDAQCDWKERQQRVLFDAADGNWNYNNNSSALDFLNAVGGRSAAESGDPRETSFLWQLISVLIQRFNAILISEIFSCPDEAPDL